MNNYEEKIKEFIEKHKEIKDPYYQRIGIFKILRESGFSEKESNVLLNDFFKDVIKKELLDYLKNIIRLIKNEKFKEIIDTYISWSPGGDDMGQDNDYLSLRILGYEDMGEILDDLKDAKSGNFKLTDKCIKENKNENN